MKKNDGRHSRSSAFSRRDFIAGAGQLGAGLTLSQLLPDSVFAQNVIKGKERLIVRSLRPEDLETPINLLNTWITPNDLFYTRHHAYVPDVKIGEWKLTVDGEVSQTLSLALDDLKKMPKAAITATL